MRIKPLLFTLPLFLTGCGATEVRDRSFIQTAGISGASQPTVTVQPFDAKAPVSGRGETLLSALETAGEGLGGKMFLGHTELLAVGEGDLIARLSTLLAGTRISPSCRLMYAPDGIADPSLSVEMARRADCGTLLLPSCGDGLRQLLGRSATAVLPCDAPEGLTLAVVDAAGKRLELLTADACRGLYWLSGGDTALVLPVEVEGEPRDVSVSGSRVVLTATPADEGLTLHIALELDCPDTPAPLRDAAKQEAERLCRAALAQTLLRHGTDVIGAEAAVQRADSGYYAAHAADWCEVLAAAQVEVFVRVRN